MGTKRTASRSDPSSRSIFVNYRRDDIGAEAQWLAKHLEGVFGADAVFFDERAIEPGDKWPDEIRQALDGARIVLACIGPAWHTCQNTKTGVPRLDEPGDWVRCELVRAKAKRIRVQPIVFGDRGELPMEAIQLRPKLRFLNKLQAIPLRRGRDLDRDLERIVETIKSAGVAPLPPEQQRQPEPADLLARYRDHVRETHARLVPFFPDLHDKLLAAVFVQLGLASSHEGEREEPQEIESDPIARPGAGSGPLEFFLWPDERDSDGDAPARLAVVGEPGAGKSTLVRHLAHTLVTRAGEVRLPVFVALGRLSVADFDPFLIAAETAMPGAPRRSELARLLRTEAAEGRAVVLLDGLDEIDGKHVDLRVVERTIETLAKDVASPIAVMTRPIALQSSSLRTTFCRVDVLPLGVAQRDQLVRNLLNREEADRFLALLQAPGSLADLCRNPLMLTMASMVGREALRKQQPVPTRRGAIYDRAVDLLLRRGHVAKGRGVRDPRLARRLLPALSLVLHEQGGEEWSLEAVDDALWQVREDAALNKRIKETWERASEGDNDAANPALLSDLGANAGVIGPLDVQTENWRYLHRSLREYLVAERLAELGPAEWKPRIEAWAKQSKGEDGEERAPTKWAEVFALLVGCVKTSKPLDVLVAIRSVSSELALRALGNADGLSPEDGLAFALADEKVGGEFLLQMCRTWFAPAEVVERLLMAHVTPETPIDRLGGVWYVLESMGRRPAREGFFAKCGRPVADAARLHAVAVPAGRFPMGSPKAEAERRASETHHPVSVPEFWLCATVVTYADFVRFERKHVVERQGRKPSDLSVHPVVHVSWWGAYLYCRWLGDDVRLPSEAEWEYACRAGTTTPFSFGANITPAQVNYDGSYSYAYGVKGEYRERTVPVGSLPANGWGLHEMHGNVWEWCEDWYGDYDKAPVDGSPQQKDHGSGLRVLRGGSWFDRARYCRSAYRFAGAPGNRGDDVGFRPASSSPRSFTTSPRQPSDQTRSNQPEQSPPPPKRAARASRKKP